TPNQERRVVVHIDAEVDSSIQVEIKKSDLITQDTLSSPIGGVDVDLYRNGRWVETRKTKLDGKAHFAYKPRSRDSLLFEIRNDTHDYLWTESVAPDFVTIDHFDSSTRRSDNRGFRIVFKDNGLTEDFYLIELRGYRWLYKFDPWSGDKTDSTLVSEPVRMSSVNQIFFSDNNVVNNRQPFELFNDQIFNGESAFKLDFDVRNFVLIAQADRSEVFKLEARLKHITKAYYQFLTTLSLNRPVYGGPFSTSSQVPSNIQGGYGIFATYASDVKELRFQ
ncbi:MAG: DUF4249 family protein, partial [Bacteroidia bacterium]|nr:DUF4249 family protein [Bacteroidia bacterium]